MNILLWVLQALAALLAQTDGGLYPFAPPLPTLS